MEVDTLDLADNTEGNDSINESINDNITDEESVVDEEEQQQEIERYVTSLKLMLIKGPNQNKEFKKQFTVRNLRKV